ncbi:hypothetical protein [Azospirillum palustre]
MSVTLRFREEGPAFERAKAVADELGLSIEDYLLACVAEGHKVLRTRAPSTWLDREEPAFVRRDLPPSIALAVLD